MTHSHGSAGFAPAWTLAASILASSLAFVDGSVTSVALPAIRHDLAASAAELQWVVNAYLLPLSALLLLGGAAGDRFGRRRMFLGGVAGFAAASLACALARASCCCSRRGSRRARPRRVAIFSFPPPPYNNISLTPPTLSLHYSPSPLSPSITAPFFSFHLFLFLTFFTPLITPSFLLLTPLLPLSLSSSISYSSA
jgi:hypothetical protein